MYQRDMPVIRDHALASPDGLADVVLFALLTIQQYLSLIPPQFERARSLGPEAIAVTQKRRGYEYALAHKSELYAQVSRARS